VNKSLTHKQALPIICGLALVISSSAVTTAAAVEPEKQPIYYNVVNGLLCGTGVTNQCKVPTGQRLIIEYVSGFVFATPSPSQTTVVSMAATDPGLGLNGASFHSFVATKVNTTPTTDVFVFATPMKVMLHPGATFYFSNVAGIGVSGYLVKFTGP
jgi:hypothetical protein